MRWLRIEQCIGHQISSVSANILFVCTFVITQNELSCQTGVPEIQKCLLRLDLLGLAYEDLVAICWEYHTHIDRMDKGAHMALHDGSDTEFLRRKDGFSLLRWTVGLSLSECSSWPIDELHFASEPTSFLLWFFLYHVDLEIKVRGIYFKEVWVSWGWWGLIHVRQCDEGAQTGWAHLFTCKVTGVSLSIYCQNNLVDTHSSNSCVWCLQIQWLNLVLLHLLGCIFELLIHYS